ncbi:MAG: PEP-CTERM sorting domain-containing protein [Chthonomonadaceae bacterium]|nr:PEP-CTERM sorting domain-containing protein [Chthonomonadaceae bacterium]
MKAQRTTKALILASFVAIAALANAHERRWDYNPAYAQNPGGGKINSAAATFNSVTKHFSFEANFGNVPGTSQKTEGFWLVVSPGANPKGHAGELSIYYFDVTHGSGPRLTTYAYNGVNGDNSFKNGNGSGASADKIASSIVNNSWINSLKYINNANGSRTLGFDIDATVIQNHTPKYPGPGGPSEWTGTSFGEKMGIWFHPVSGLSSSYGSDGFLKGFQYCSQGWLDGENFVTTPEPASMAALGIGVVALARRRRKSA